MNLTYLQFSSTTHRAPGIASDLALITIAFTFSTLTETSYSSTMSAIILLFKHQRGRAEMLLILELTRCWPICTSISWKQIIMPLWPELCKDFCCFLFFFFFSLEY